MTQPPPDTNASGFRVFSACLLSFLLIMMPFVQLAAASRRGAAAGSRRAETARQVTDNREETAIAPENVVVNGPIPEPAPEPLAVDATQLKITLEDGVAVGNS